MTEPEELELLSLLLGVGAARKVGAAPGGWRSQSETELGSLRLPERRQKAVLALQRLAARTYPPVPSERILSAEAVGRLFGERLSPLMHEVVIAIALDGQNRIIGDFEVARGGRHGAALTPADVFRPLIRAGASAGLLVHNHPSGDAAPSEQDRELTRELRKAGAVIEIPILDHVVIAARGGGYVSFLEAGMLEE